MAIPEQLTADLKAAMKARDQLRIDAIRMIKAAVQSKELDLNRNLDEVELSRVMTTLIKQRKEAAEQFEKGNRQDLAQKELREVSIIEQYLPKALSEAEIVQVIETVIRETGATSPKDVGPVMKAVMGRLAAQPVDGKRVNELVRAKLQ